MAILGWGYQPERLLAAKVIMLYTIGGSLILFINIIIIINEGDVLLKLLTTGTRARIQMLFEVGIFFAFLIKLPLYGFHVWLPMAHVEAPMWGSMVLASIILKLGGYGIVRVIQLISNKIKWVIILIVVLRLISFILCCTIVDIKIIVAYRRVGHIRIGLGALLTMSYFGKQSLIVNILAHGAASSIIFMYVTFLYIKRGSRRLMYNKGILILNPIIIVMWYVVCVINMGGPLTPRLYVEVIQTVSLFNIRKVLGLILFGVIVLRLLFNIILFNFPAKENIMKGIIKMRQDSNIIMSGYFHLAITLLVLAII
ncbi:NADH-ubiquinone oxidoreductase chain 4-like [Labrus mixtus]|uniref:NADH-ubiquinone oxidoreductase chain 4-like n=1 Tax=Labrus mixtus TaxID=508554 RepID=UPI0029C0772D|nr:NADH-ubiquinone oxidoreductase chain 4-like [Labrus mixtus]